MNTLGYLTYLLYLFHCHNIEITNMSIFQKLEKRVVPIFSTEWVDYVEEPMRVLGWVGVGSGWVGDVQGVGGWWCVGWVFVSTFWKIIIPLQNSVGDHIWVI